jgi:hypothetical protein
MHGKSPFVNPVHFASFFWRSIAEMAAPKKILNWWNGAQRGFMVAAAIG